MKPNFFVIFCFLLSASLSLVDVSYSYADVHILCLQKDGTIIGRFSKCKKNETKASMFNLPQQGLKGVKGTSGNAAVLNREVLYSSQVLIFNAAEAKTAEQLCPVGKVTLGGGCLSSNLANLVTVEGTYPFDSSPQQAWRCDFHNDDVNSFQTSTVTVLAICGTAS